MTWGALYQEYEISRPATPMMEAGDKQSRQECGRKLRFTRAMATQWASVVTYIEWFRCRGGCGCFVRKKTGDHIGDPQVASIR